MMMLVILLLCLGVWMTPHSLVASMEEARKMGGTHHPVARCLRRHVGKNDGLESHDSYDLHEFHHVLAGWETRDSRMGQAGPSRHGGHAGIIAGIVVVVLGVWGYFVPAIVALIIFPRRRY
jgi:cytochrome bd ubiquinol oxidase subunit I